MSINNKPLVEPQHIEKQRKSRSLNDFGICCLLELLGRFELPTSSLPRMRSTY